MYVFFPVPFGELLSDIGQYDPIGQGISFSGHWDVLVALVCDGILMCIIYWYLSNVVEGDYGTAKQLNFFCKPAYWRSFKTRRSEDQRLLINVYLLL